MYVQASYLGEAFEGVPLVYAYQPDEAPTLNERVRTRLWRWGVDQMYVDSVLFGYRLAKRYPRAAFIAHEPFTAMGLALARVPYFIIYNNQGARPAERLGLGEELSEQQQRALHWMERWAFRRARFVSFSSQGARTAYLETTRYNQAGRFREGPILYNTICPDPSPVPAADQAQLDQVPPGDVCFLTIAQLSATKAVERIPAFLDDYQRQSGHRVTWIVVGVGEGAQEEIVRQEIERHGLRDQVTLILNADFSHAGVLAACRKADAYILLSRRSIFDFATLEAMRDGCALILSDVGGNPEFDVDDNVILVDPDQPASALERLAKADIKELGERNRQAFEQSFGKAAFCDRYAEAIQALISH